MTNVRMKNKNPGKRYTKPKYKIPFVMQVIRACIPVLDRLLPALAAQWFTRLFFTPLRYPFPAYEQMLLKASTLDVLTVAGKRINVYTWGDGPVVLFVHGWSGRGSQFVRFIESFTRAGYRAVAFDAPAHGRSKGKRTSVFDFKDCILAINGSVGQIEAVVAHSLGGTASLFAIAEGLPVNRLITIATPTSGEAILQEFTQRLNGSARLKKALRANIEQRFNCSFDDLMANYFAGQLKGDLPWLIVHDDKDKEAPVENATLLKQVYTNARVFQTSGLGHVRILRDVDVVNTCLLFIQTQDASLPQPYAQVQAH